MLCLSKDPPAGLFFYLLNPDLESKLFVFFSNDVFNTFYEDNFLVKRVFLYPKIDNEIRLQFPVIEHRHLLVDIQIVFTV
jgi:hypothetical protein